MIARGCLAVDVLVMVIVLPPSGWLPVGRGRATTDKPLYRQYALAEPTRRRTYEAVQRAGGPLSRVEVAEDVGIRTRLAAFHLDRLVEEGLLVAHYARPAGRPGGPGAG